MKKRHILSGLLMLLLVVALGAVAAACGGTTTTTTAATTPTTAPSASTTAGETTTSVAETSTTANTTPIKVGHIVDLSGYQATVGGYFKTALDYAFGTTGNMVAGRAVEVITEDSKSDTQAALDAAKKLVESDHVVAIFGPTDIGEKTAVAAYCGEVGVPLILYNPTTAEITESNKWVIGAGGSVRQSPTCMADYIYNTLGYRKIITITWDLDGARTFMNPLAEYFTKLGGEVVQEVRTALTTNDYAPYLTNLKQADAVVAWEAGSQAITFLTQYHELGIDKKMPLVGAYHGGFLDPWVPQTIAKASQAAADAVVGATAPMAWSPEFADPANAEFIKGMTSVLGFPPSDGAFSCAVQGVTLFVKAVESTGGDTTPEALRTALLSTSIVGPEGPQSFANGAQAATKNIYIVKVEKVPNTAFFHYVTVKTYENVPPAGFSGQ